MRMQLSSLSYMNMAVAGVLTFVSVAPASVVVDRSEMSSQIYHFTVCCYSLGARCTPRLRRVSKNGQNASRDDGSNEHRCLVLYWSDAIGIDGCGWSSLVWSHTHNVREWLHLSQIARRVIAEERTVGCGCC